MKQILNNFFIFGDSYSDEHAPPYPNHPNQYENDEWQIKHSYRWPLKLKHKFNKSYNFKNFSLMGSSPYFSLKNLLKNIHAIKENDIVLFFVSDFDRIDFLCEIKEIKKHLSNIFYSKRTMKADLIEDETFEYRQKLKAFYLMNESEIDFFYKNFFNILPPVFLRELFIGFLKNLSKDRKCKIIVFDKNEVTTISKNDKNFYMFNRALRFISEDEYSNDKIKVKDIMIKDDRVNHMSLENHEIMLAMIMKIINNEKIDHINFYKEIVELNSDNTIFVSNSSRDFIYE